ncbi:hypothetical protein [Tissierella sp.]|uniref:hypothetical protein n=1 Tax=Tissierella sp. TaxID=41274 RepID=UPI00285743A2|nr:hypothetical protein [Tissierella sp.]MDR7856838.1 hypothetical protein [Tissierella sp.]
MRLSDYNGKKIKVTLKDGEIFQGKCIEYIKAIDNDPEIPSIDLQVNKKIYEIYENEIKSIEIVN